MCYTASQSRSYCSSWPLYWIGHNGYDSHLDLHRHGAVRHPPGSDSLGPTPGGQWARSRTVGLWPRWRPGPFGFGPGRSHCVFGNSSPRSLSNSKLILILIICKPHGLEITWWPIKYPRIKKNAQHSYTHCYPGLTHCKTNRMAVFLIFGKFAHGFFLRCITRPRVLSYGYVEATTPGVARSLLTAQ